MATLKTGCKAYYDSFAGLIPCKVISVTDTTKHDGIDFQLTAGSGSTAHRVTCRITADKGGYKKGEVIESSSLHVVPRESVRFKNYSAVILAFNVEFDGGTK